MRRTVLVACLGALAILPACTASSSVAGNAAHAPLAARVTGTDAARVTGTDAARVTGTDAATATLELTVSPATPATLDLVPVANDVFTMDLPAGWTWESVGEYTSFGIRAYDPASPCRQVFFYSKMEPLIKSEEARAIYRASADAVDGPSYAQMYADAPVLAPRTARQFFAVFDRYTAFAHAYGIDHAFASLADLEVVEVLPLRTPIADYTVDDAVVRGLFTDGGVPCEGMFGASVFDSGPYVVEGVDTSPLAVYNVMGIAARGDELGQLEETLARVVASFAYTAAYVQAAQEHVAAETGAMLAYAETMSAAQESYDEAWAARQTAADALAQRRSDAALGYDRLYDPATGEVYRADQGFYEAYDAGRGQCSNPGLLLVPADDVALWTRPIDGYLSR